MATTAMIALGGSVAVAQDPAQLADARSAPFGSVRRAMAGYETLAAHGGAWQAVAFYRVVNADVRLPNGLPWIEYAARRVSGSPDGPSEISWTSSRDCPALVNILVWMTGLTAPAIEIAGISPRSVGVEGRRPIVILADGVEVTVWGRGTQGDDAVNTWVEMRSNAGAIGAFGRAATDSLRSCWQPEPPVF